jgi:hypothetical protein
MKADSVAAARAEMVGTSNRISPILPLRVLRHFRIRWFACSRFGKITRFGFVTFDILLKESTRTILSNDFYAPYWAKMTMTITNAVRPPP